MQTHLLASAKISKPRERKFLFSRRYQWPQGLRRRSAAARFWDLGFESSQGHGCPSLVCVVRWQVEVSATDGSFIQSSPTECVCVCVFV